MWLPSPYWESSSPRISSRCWTSTLWLKNLLYAATKVVQPTKDNDGALLHIHHRVHILKSFMTIWYCCQCQGQKQAAVCHSHCWEEDDWWKSATSSEPVRFQDPEEGSPLTPLTVGTNCLRHYPPTGGWGPSRLIPNATRTISLHPQLASLSISRIHHYGHYTLTKNPAMLSHVLH